MTFCHVRGGWLHSKKISIHGFWVDPCSLGNFTLLVSTRHMILWQLTQRNYKSKFYGFKRSEIAACLILVEIIQIWSHFAHTATISLITETLFPALMHIVPRSSVQDNVCKTTPPLGTNKSPGPVILKLGRISLPRNEIRWSLRFHKVERCNTYPFRIGLKPLQTFAFIS